LYIDSIEICTKNEFIYKTNVMLLEAQVSNNYNPYFLKLVTNL